MAVIPKLLLLLVTGSLTIAERAEQPCRDNRGDAGICRLAANCPLALTQISDRIYPKICSFHGTQVIVCCTEISQTSMKATVIPSTTERITVQPLSVNSSFNTQMNKLSDGSTGSISRAKCKEYAKYAYDKPTNLLITAKSSRRILECPFEKEKLIVGGSKAARQEFPHMAQIGYDFEQHTEWLCAGSIVSPNFILTAGHCLNNRAFGSPKFVRVGVTNLSDTTHVQIRQVVSIIKYPQYNFQKYHDIGLLKLSHNIDFDIYARPACLFTESDVPTDKAIVTGWGRQSFKGESSQDLMKVVLERFPATSCNSSWSREINELGSELHRGILDDYMVCYGSKSDLKDACQGDSGGPLQIYHPDTEDVRCMYWIVGITSFGKGCGMAVNTPGIYTKVSSYVDWIEDIVWRSQM